MNVVKTAIIATIFFLISTLGCSSIPFKDTKSEENLKQRVNALYSNREVGNYLKAYEYENMSLDGKISEKDYASGFSSRGIRNVNIQGIKIENDTAMVTIKAKLLTPKLTGFERFNPEIDTEFQDKWVFRNNNWYHVIKSMNKEW
jgi:hypothetical protein